MPSSQINKDVYNFASKFGRMTANVGVEKSLGAYFLDADMTQFSNKTEKIKYLLSQNLSNISELQIIVETILETHPKKNWESDINSLNKMLTSLNLRIDDENHNVEILKEHSVEAMINNLQMEATNDSTIKNIIPKDVVENGKQMAEAYLLIYCFENTLRTFIDNISENKYGDDYWNHLNMPNNVKNKVIDRMNKGEKTPFHSVRGDKKLFYADMGDLLKIIEQNWNELFDSYFPNLGFIKTRIEESQITRNHVAHNSWISSDDYNRVFVFYKDLLKQLENHI